MSRNLRISLIVGGVLVVLVALTPFLIPVNRFRPAIERNASAALGRTVALGRLRLSLLTGSLSADTLSVGDDQRFSTSPFLTAKSVNVGVKLLPLLFGSLNVTSITIDQPEVTLIRNSAGKWNYASLGSSFSDLSAISIAKLELKDGRMIVGSTTQKRRSTYDHVNVTVSGVSLASTSPVTATAALPGGGTFKLAGNIGPLDQADASLTPLDATIAINGLNLATTGFLDPSAGLGGLLDLKATIASKRDEAGIAGSGRLSKALLVAGGSPLSQPIAVEFKSKYNLHKQSGVLNSSTLKIGGAVARLDGSYDTGGDYTVVKIKMIAERIPAADLESFLPALGIHLPRGAHLAAGTGAANLSVVGATNRLVATGTAGLFNARLTGFDLGSKVRAISAFSGLNTGGDIDIRTLTTNIRIAQDGLRFDHFNALVPSIGLLTGGGTIDARNNLNFGMVATLTHPLSGGLGTALGTAGALGAGASDALNAGTAGALNQVFGMFMGREASVLGKSVPRTAAAPRIAFLIKGTTSDPQFIPDVGGFVLDMLQRQLSMKP